MPQTPHIEQHFTASDAVRDVVIVMADGLTVPFALAAGLSGAVAATGILVTAGLEEIAAGSIAVGLGGSLLFVSVGITLLALLVFGSGKGRFTGARPWKRALQTAAIGSVAATAAFAIARAVG